jgi:hypothetical protein
MSVEPRRRLAFRPRHAGMAVAGLCLAWLVMAHSGAAFLASRSPELALALHRDEPEALMAIAQRLLAEALTEKKVEVAAARSPSAGPSPRRQDQAPGGDATGKARVNSGGSADQPPAPLAPGTPAAEKIGGAAKRALLAAPLDSRALRVLAQLADAAGDKLEKSKLLDATLRHTKHEPLAAFWLMLEAAERNDDGAAVRYADIIMSTHGELSSLVVPVLAARQESKGGSPALKARLAENPPWRGRFFSELMPAITDARTPLDLLLTLKDTPNSPTAGEIGGYLEFLMRKQLYELGYYAWLQFLAPEDLKKVKLVNNGGFEIKPAPTPFDWAIPSSSGTIVDIRTPPGETGRSLYVGFIGQGRVELQPVHQTLVLQPGQYRLVHRQKGEVIGRRGVQWTVTCVNPDVRIGESPMFVGTQAEWKDVEARFKVPDETCRAQTLRLILAARSASEQIVKGAAWFDDVRIERVLPE